MQEAVFRVPAIADNEEGWGPVSVTLGSSPLPNLVSTTKKLNEIPYAPFSKGDRVGKAADWYSVSTKPGFQPRYQNYGASAPFSYKYEEDDESFQVVDTRTVKPAQYTKKKYQQFAQRPQRPAPNQQGTSKGQTTSTSSAGKGAWGKQAATTAAGKGKTSGQGGSGARPYNRYQDGGRSKQRSRESSVDIKPDWNVVEQFEIAALSKLSVSSVPEPEELTTAGSLEYFNKQGFPASSNIKLERVERQFFKITTTDDPIIRELTEDPEKEGTVYATDAILAHLTSCPRSVYSWDLLVHRVGSVTFLDKREQSQFDYLTVNETANEPPSDDKDPVNSPAALSQEATFINQNFSQQTLLKGGKKFNFERPNPFAGEGGKEGVTVAPVGYRYRRWNIGDHTLVARTEVDAVLPSKDAEHPHSFLLVKALNEFDPKSGVDWRKKLDTSRGAVLATEIKNNSNKLAKWTSQAILAGADQIAIGYVSRQSVKDSFAHAVLGTQIYPTKDFAAQMALIPKNMWGILKHFFDSFAKLPSGKFILVKDPNKPIIRLYAVPLDAFEDLDESAPTTSSTSSSS
eukprot:TRINITY_DN325_c0_g1_i1.p1 TRINITY_DN325_c0_g1~~TRINITY_DN325_c0_g1_i1.p1  ORF type:complete len:571 (-),score=207.84 TRINITY_DN325_c0_g1_i1:60-1772(-)